MIQGSLQSSAISLAWKKQDSQSICGVRSC